MPLTSVADELYGATPTATLGQTVKGQHGYKEPRKQDCYFEPCLFKDFTCRAFFEQQTDGPEPVCDRQQGSNCLNPARPKVHGNADAADRSRQRPGEVLEPDSP